jgi:hypothetical protein
MFKTCKDLAEALLKTPDAVPTIWDLGQGGRVDIENVEFVEEDNTVILNAVQEDKDEESA